MKPIKILYCIDSLVRGGTELQLKEMMERMDESNYTPYLLTIRPTDTSLTPRNCCHLEWDVPSLFSVDGFKAMRKLLKFLQDEDIQVVQTFFQDSTIFAGLAAKMAGVPVRMASCRDMAFWHTAVQGFAMRLMYKLMTGFICNAEVVRGHFSGQYHIDPGRAYVLRNGMDYKSLPYVKHQGAVTDIGIVGNMTRQVKRIDLFIKAAALVAKSYPNIRWHIVGDGYLKEQLELLAAELGIREQILFVGRVDDVATYLEKLQIGVNCSDSEGLSNALLEYMFKGVAVVATKVGGSPELLEGGKAGLLVPPDDAGALSEALISLIDNSDLRQSVSAYAREYVEKNYSWDKCLAEHDAVYRRQLEGAK